MTTFLPLETALSGTWQERVATPSMCTVQEPHWAMPQPYLVPVMPSVSRSTQSSGVRGSALAWSDLPLTLSTAMAVSCEKSVVPNGEDPIAPAHVPQSDTLVAGVTGS